MSEPIATAPAADITEEVVADTDAAQNAAAPVLNRAERRAQAHGKKGGTAPNTAMPQASNLRGPGGQSTGNAGVAARFQRKTGGK